MISRQVTVMVRLIDDLLDISRISCNKLEMRKQRILLSEVLECAVEGSRPLILAGRHQLNVRLPQEPIELDADLIRLCQVFSNLLNNAAKYTKPGGQIDLSVGCEGNEAVIRVRDSGIGISSEMLPRIFEIFTQVDQSLERSQGGLGIGLTLVRRLIELHYGTIEAHSGGLDQGSEFIVRLPVLQPQSQLPVCPDEHMAAHLSANRILVVDDNRDSADSLAMLLRLMGNELRVAYDGFEALELAESFRPNLILLDIGLPKLNGYDVARSIRRQPWGREITLVALTGWGQDKDKCNSADAGFNFHIVKPVKMSDLERMLDSSAEELQSTATSRQATSFDRTLES